MIFLILLASLFLANAYNDNTGSTVTYYPSALLLTANPRPIFFFHDTQVVHFKFSMSFRTFAIPIPEISIKCSKEQHDFMTHILQTMELTEKSILKLFSVPSVTKLVECVSYLKRLYKLYVGLQPRLRCSPFFHNSLERCKKGALKNVVILYAKSLV